MRFAFTSLIKCRKILHCLALPCHCTQAIVFIDCNEFWRNSCFLVRVKTQPRSLPSQIELTDIAPSP